MKALFPRHRPRAAFNRPAIFNRAELFALIGGVVIRTLGDKYTFSGLDRAQTADAPDIPTTVADVSNFDAIRPAFDGMDAVIHLAADAGMHAPWTSVLPNNIVATYNVFEAARQAGVLKPVHRVVVNAACRPR